MKPRKHRYFGKPVAVFNYPAIGANAGFVQTAKRIIITDTANPAWVDYLCKTPV